MFYILDEDGEPQEAADLETWAVWWEYSDNRRIARDVLIATYPPDHDGEEIVVSTVFLGIDHNFHGGDPVLFETLVFGGSMDGEMWRYTSREEAIEGHAEILARVKKVCSP